MRKRNKEQNQFKKSICRSIINNRAYKNKKKNLQKY